MRDRRVAALLALAALVLLALGLALIPDRDPCAGTTPETGCGVRR